MDNFGNMPDTGANNKAKNQENAQGSTYNDGYSEIKSSMESISMVNMGATPGRAVKVRKDKNTVLIVIIAVLAVLLVVSVAAGVLISNDIIQIGKKNGEKLEQKQEEEPEEKPEEGPEEKPEELIEESAEEITSMEMYVANVENAIYLRSKPEEGDNIIKTIPVRTKVNFLKNENAIFAKIEWDGLEGYVKREYLSQSRPAPKVQQENTTVVKTMFVAGVPNSIYLRSGASESSSVITTIPVGREVGYIERANSIFSKIKYNGTIGYAKTEYLSDYYTDTSPGNMVVCNVPNSIYLRSGASESSSVITTIPVGSTVSFIENANGTFYKISWNGYTGYAKAKFLRSQ